MITELLLSFFLAIPKFVIGLLPNVAIDTLDGMAGLGTVLAYALYFFPVDIWIVVLANGVIMLTVAFGYGVLEWVWKKIPGVN